MGAVEIGSTFRDRLSPHPFPFVSAQSSSQSPTRFCSSYPGSPKRKARICLIDGVGPWANSLPFAATHLVTSMVSFTDGLLVKGGVGHGANFPFAYDCIERVAKI